MNELTSLPALIDPHVHFRVPGEEHKEDWKTAADAAIRGGVTTVLDMPNNHPPCNRLEQLLDKKRRLDSQLKAVGIPLRYGLYFGADKNHFDQIKLAQPHSVALKIFMPSAHEGLVIDSDAALHEAFRQAKEANLLVAVHAEEETLFKQVSKTVDPAMHSQIRSKEAAIRATEKAIDLATLYQTPLYLLHLTTREELALVRQAKRDGLPVYAEVTTHHLFFTQEDYPSFGTLIQLNPPLRDRQDQEALWEGISDGTVDTLGTDHAPHTFEEKRRPFGEAPSGMPGIETLLPLMLNAVHEKRLTLERLIELTRTNSEKIFHLPPNSDVVLVDLNLEKEVSDGDIRSKCGWTPYRGRVLRGWPIYTILRGQTYYASGYKKEY